MPDCTHARSLVSWPMSPPLGAKCSVSSAAVMARLGVAHGLHLGHAVDEGVAVDAAARAEAPGRRNHRPTGGGGELVDHLQRPGARVARRRHVDLERQRRADVPDAPGVVVVGGEVELVAPGRVEPEAVARRREEEGHRVVGHGLRRWATDSSPTPVHALALGEAALFGPGVERPAALVDAVVALAEAEEALRRAAWRTRPPRRAA